MITIIVLMALALAGHELGHLIAGLAFRVQISKFCLFFDPGFRLVDTRKRFNIRFCMGWIPFGAYVKFATKGENSSNGVFIQDLHPLKRAVISLAGVIMNLLLTYLCIFIWVNHYADSESQTELKEHIHQTNTIIQNEVVHCTSYITNYWKLGGEAEDTNSEDIQIKTSQPESIGYTMIWQFALLNLFLTVFNLFPIPPLDGAQTLYNIYEYLFHRPVNTMFLLAAGILGMLLIMGSNMYDLWKLLWEFIE